MKIFMKNWMINPFKIVWLSKCMAPTILHFRSKIIRRGMGGTMISEGDSEFPQGLLQLNIFLFLRLSEK